jgi:virulence-associated protein VapD
VLTKRSNEQAFDMTYVEGGEAFDSSKQYAGHVYAIAFDMDTAAMEAAYPGDSWRNGYKEIEDILDRHGFEQKQGSVYYGDETINVVKTILAVQDLSRKLRWFKESVRDIRMLRINDNDDLREVL